MTTALHGGCCGRARTLVAAVALLVPSLAPQAAERPASAPIFKGSWTGPPVIRLPGKGPAPGQSLEDYFIHMKTGPRSPAVKRVLVLGGARKFHHDSTSSAMAGVHRWGQENGLWDTELRTDFTLVSSSGGGPMNAGFQPKGLADFDAVVVANADGDWQLSPAQKKALLDFVRCGKGLVVMHGGLDANHDWPDYIDMIGAEHVGHPFNTPEQPVYPFPLLSETTTFPATAFFASSFIKQDELYTVRNWSRQDIDVLLRMDASAMPMASKGDEVPPDHDIPVAWIKNYGRGRVFSSTLGHTREAYMDPEIARMYSEAIKWALGLTSGPYPNPHPRR